MTTTTPDWDTLFKEAAAGKFGAPFPDGNLVQGVTEDGHIQYYHEPTEGGALAGAEIDIYFGVDPVETYNEIKKDSLEAKDWRVEGHQIDGWKEWPHGYPDQNDYEGVSHCGKTDAGNKVAWVQGKALVVLSSVAGGKTLEEYADGVWNIVYQAFGM
jgi:hypothetical protein